MTPREMQLAALPQWSAVVVGVVFVVYLGCRVPDPPVLKRPPLVIMYDSAEESQLRNDKPRRFGLVGMERYVDTLSEPVAVTEWDDDRCVWEVFVATNRGKLDSCRDPNPVNRGLDELHFGRCEVTLPRDDVGMRLEKSAKRKESGRNSDKSVATVSSVSSGETAAATVDVTQLDEVEFLEGVTSQVNRSRQRDILVFVHGFNVSFDSALINTAELGLKIPFNGAIVSYCWPTQGGVLNYSTDEPINKASVAPFTLFLATLRAGVPVETRINIVVHSMGNRIVMESLNKLPSPRGTKPFNHLVLCAPDVGRGDFLKWAPGVVDQCERVTLYANASDTALIASKSLHAEKRAGDAHVPLVVDGIETIDCSRIDQTLMGHSYFSNNRDVTTDLFMLLKENLPPSRRVFLEKKKSSGGPYWQFAQHAPTIMCTWHFDDLEAEDAEELSQVSAEAP